MFFAVNDVPPFEMSSCEWSMQDIKPSFPSSPQPCPILTQPTNHTTAQDRTAAQATGHLGEKSGDYQSHVLPPFRRVGVKGVQVPGELQRHHLELIWKRTEWSL